MIDLLEFPLVVESKVKVLPKDFKLNTTVEFDVPSNVMTSDNVAPAVNK